MSRRAHWLLTVCLTLEWLGLGVWVGGMIVLIGAVIPAVFNTFGGQDQGGFFLTRTFEGYNRLVMVVMLLLALVAVVRWRQGGDGIGLSRLEIVLFVLMCAIAGTIVLFLHPWAARLQAEAFAEKDEQARKAAFEAFFQLHMPVRSLYMVNLGLGITLLVVKTRRLLRREEVQS